MAYRVQILSPREPDAPPPKHLLDSSLQAPSRVSFTVSVDMNPEGTLKEVLHRVASRLRIQADCDDVTLVAMNMLDSKPMDIDTSASFNARGLLECQNITFQTNSIHVDLD